MSGFVASPPPAAGAPDLGDAVLGDAFWPALSIAAFRGAMIVPEHVTPIRARDALRAGMVTVRRELAAWRYSRMLEGSVKLVDIWPGETIDGEPMVLLLYRNAVHHAAAAQLAESHHDVSATGDGRDRNEDRARGVDELRRLAIVAIRDLLARSRTAVELI